MAESEKRHKVSKTFTVGSYRLRTKRTLFSLVVAFLITLFLNWQTIASLIPTTEVPTLYLTLEGTNYPTFGIAEIDEYIERQAYVANYDADIYISISPEKISVGDYVRFKVNIVDKGIIPIQKPCFHFFITNPQGEAVSGFTGIGHLSQFSTLNRWNTIDHYNDFYTDSLHYISDEKQYYLPRKTLIEGYGKYVYVNQNTLYWSDSPTEIVFQFKINDNPSLIGQWQITLFVFDENYIDRFGEQVDTHNFINYQVNFFEVVSKSPPPPPVTTGDVLSLIYAVITFALSYFLTYLGIYTQLEKHKEKLVRLQTMLKENILFVLSIIIIIALVIIYLLFLR